MEDNNLKTTYATIHGGLGPCLFVDMERLGRALWVGVHSVTGVYHIIRRRIASRNLVAYPLVTARTWEESAAWASTVHEFYAYTYAHKWWMSAWGGRRSDSMYTGLYTSSGDIAINSGVAPLVDIDDRLYANKGCTLGVCYSKDKFAVYVPDHVSTTNGVLALAKWLEDIRSHGERLSINNNLELYLGDEVEAGNQKAIKCNTETS